MLKKFLVAAICLLIMSAQASAMRLTLYLQPIGKISFYNDRFNFEGAKIIKGNEFKGIVLFGDYLYLHYDSNDIYSRFGARNKKNTISVDIQGETEIYLIDSTANLPLYLLKKSSSTSDAIKVIGLRGGKWIEHLNALDFREKYNIGHNFQLSKFFTNENRIIFRYTLQNNIIDVICRWHAVNEKFYPEMIEQ